MRSKFQRSEYGQVMLHGRPLFCLSATELLNMGGTAKQKSFRPNIWDEEAFLFF